jgi:hypothetical protein
VNAPLSITEQPTSLAPQFSAHTNLPPASAGTVYPAHEPTTIEMHVCMLNLPSADFKFILLTQDRQSLNLRFRRLERTIASLEDTFIERVNDLEMGIGNWIAHELASGKTSHANLETNRHNTSKSDKL